MMGVEEMPPVASQRLPRSNSDPEVERSSSPLKKSHPVKQTSVPRIDQVPDKPGGGGQGDEGRKPLKEVDDNTRVNVSTGNLPNEVSFSGHYTNGSTVHTNHDRTLLEKSTSYQSCLSENMHHVAKDTNSKRASSDNSIPKCGLQTHHRVTVNGTSNVTPKDENQTNAQSHRKTKGDLGRPKMIIGSGGDYHITYHSLQRPKKTIDSDKDMPPMIDRRKSEPPNLGMFSIEDEDYLPNSIVLDWDSYPNNNNMETPAVATIEVTNLGYQEPSPDSISSPRTPRRPDSLQGSLNGCLDSGLGSPASGHAISITNGAQSPTGTPAGTPVGPLPTFNNPAHDMTDSLSSTPHHEPGSSTVLQGGATSSSFASVSSLNTELSSNVSTTDDSLGGEEGGFVEVSLYGGGGEKGLPSNFDGQGAKPKKKGIAGFLAR